MNEQWVKLIEDSSYRSRFPDAICRNTGVEKLFQSTDSHFGENDSIDNGWILSNDNREEYLVVSFQTPVFINEIHIYESLNSGSIVRLQMLESRQRRIISKCQWLTMWERRTSPTVNESSTSNIFKPILRRYHLRSNTLRITFDPRYADRISIQAIKLIGSTEFDENFRRIALPQAVLKLYEQIFDSNKTDIQFLIENRIVNAHRNILCCRCSYFRALLLDDFHERNQQKPIQLTDIDYETFIELLFFIYTGAFHPNISYDLALKCLIYSNKINFSTGKDAALERICCYLRFNHHLILSIYCLIKQMSPAFDCLLDYVYELFALYMKEICLEQEFFDLDKDLIVDLLRQSSQRNNQEKK